MRRIVIAILMLPLISSCTGGVPGVVGTNTCQYANDGECDDGRLGAHTNQCELNTDANDCADVDPTVCQTTNDGECDDGRPGALFDICAPGTDEADCEILPPA